MKNGWVLRFAHGVSRRANSVAPLPPDNKFDLDDTLRSVEAFYRTRGLPPRVQISPAAEPEGLDQILANRGFEIETPVNIQIARASDLARLASPSTATHVDRQAPAGWWTCYETGYARNAKNIAAKAREQTLFATWRDPEDAIRGIGLGVVGGNWLGIFGMWTDPNFRRQGIGSQIIASLSQTLFDRGGLGVYLQVEDSNETAKQLYAKLGFRTLYSYHYRTLWTDS